MKILKKNLPFKIENKSMNFSLTGQTATKGTKMKIPAGNLAQEPSVYCSVLKTPLCCGNNTMSN
jgi:hypothetical protein